MSTIPSNVPILYFTDVTITNATSVTIPAPAIPVGTPSTYLILRVDKTKFFNAVGASGFRYQVTRDGNNVITGYVVEALANVDAAYTTTRFGVLGTQWGAATGSEADNSTSMSWTINIGSTLTMPYPISNAKTTLGTNRLAEHVLLMAATAFKGQQTTLSSVFQQIPANDLHDNISTSIRSHLSSQVNQQRIFENILDQNAGIVSPDNTRLYYTDQMVDMALVFRIGPMQFNINRNAGATTDTLNLLNVNLCIHLTSAANIPV